MFVIGSHYRFVFVICSSITGVQLGFTLCVGKY